MSRWSLSAWWAGVKRRRDCFHHDTRNPPDSSWIESHGFIDYRKVWRCVACGKVWVL